jgi:hypothetical protein
MMVNGTMANNMAEANILTVMAVSGRVYGSRENALDGWMNNDIFYNKNVFSMAFLHFIDSSKFK